MRTFLLTGEFAGEIELRYNELELLVGYEHRAAFDEAQHRWFSSHFPRSLSVLDKFSHIPRLSVKEVTRALSFADFWAAYFQGRQKDNSSKKKAEASWQKMPKSEQLKAFNYISTYRCHIAPGTNPKYAETYLNSELWNN